MKHQVELTLYSLILIMTKNLVLTKPRLCLSDSVEVMQMHRIKAFLYSLLNKKFSLSLFYLSIPQFFSASVYFSGAFSLLAGLQFQ